MVARGLGTRQASFGDEGDEHGTAAGAGELVRLKRASAVLQDLGLHERLDVLHVNCEGCALAAEGPALWDFGWGSAYPRRGAPGGPLGRRSSRGARIAPLEAMPHYVLAARRPAASSATTRPAV